MMAWLTTCALILKISGHVAPTSPKQLLTQVSEGKVKEYSKISNDNLKILERLREKSPGKPQAILPLAVKRRRYEEGNTLPMT